MTPPDAAAKRTFRWGVLSTADVALRHFIPEVRSSIEGTISAIASRDLGRAREAAASLGISRAHGSYEELLADPEIDGVYIALPNALHPEWTIRAAESGKHVLCEKPLATSIGDADRMAEACRRAGVLLMEAFMYRLHPQHARVRDLIREGTIGEPAILRASLCYAIAPERRPGSARFEADLAGGAFLNVACYGANTARYIFDAEPLEVMARQRVDPRFGVDTAFTGILRFPGDRLAVIDGSFDVHLTQRYEVAGSAGTIRLDQAYIPHGVPTVVQMTTARGDHTEEFPGVHQFALEADHFVRSVREDKLLPPMEDGVAQAAVTEALRKSAATGKAVAVRQ